MLVLSRKREESIVINENIVIKIIEVKGNKVRLGIEAPQDVKIMRSELIGPREDLAISQYQELHSLSFEEQSTSNDSDVRQSSPLLNRLIAQAG